MQSCPTLTAFVTSILFLLRDRKGNKGIFKGTLAKSKSCVVIFFSQETHPIMCVIYFPGSHRIYLNISSRRILQTIDLLQTA
jgi:hypothetical protein